MELNQKTYSTCKIKKYLKRNNFFYFYNGVNKSSSDWIYLVEQNLKNLNFSYYKNLNKILKKTLKNSTYNILQQIVTGPTFFIKYDSKSPLTKQLGNDKLETLLFVLLVVKFNNTFYPISLLKLINSVKYKEDSAISHQFYYTHIKCYKKISK